MSITKPKNFVIVGGSLGGLLMGVALKSLRKDLNIRILERSPSNLLQDQGAGIVAWDELRNFFKKHDRTQTELAITSHEREYLDKAGQVISREKREQHMTSWDLLYHILRANYDGFKSEYVEAPEQDESPGSATYEPGCKVTDIEAPEPTQEALDYSKPVRLTVKHKTGETSVVEADVVIAADGPSSTIRSKYLPDVKREYAGYVAWRGTVPENQVSDAAREVFVEKFPFFHAEHIQILAYTIPGKNGTLEPGKRLLNWVWYVNYEQDSRELIETMTDKDGIRHHITLPAGGVKDEVWKRQKEYADEILPPQFAELVNKTEVPFIQAITDVIAPSAMLASGRVLLIGDALAGFRPHTAMSTGQAARDAITLSDAVEEILNGGGKDVLQKWEEHVLKFAKTMQSHGVWIGNRSQFRKDPKADE